MEFWPNDAKNILPTATLRDPFSIIEYHLLFLGTLIQFSVCFMYFNIFLTIIHT